MMSGGAVAILGMHRSGTSCLAGTLESHGLALGDVSHQSPHNKKGNKENKAFRQLNESILQHSGGCWDSPPASIKWTVDHSAERDRLLQEQSSVPIWGFKDPRTVLTFEFWREAMPQLAVVATFRNPVSVVRSLTARAALLPKSSPQILWVAYNKQLLDIIDRTNASVVCFDWDRDRYVRCTAHMARELGLASKPIDHFHDETLDHQGGAMLTNTCSTPHLKEIYDALMAKAIRTERAINGHNGQT